MNKRESLKTKCQNCLRLLMESRRFDLPFNLAQGFGQEIVRGYLPIWAFQEAYIGGSSGDRRKRDLHDKFGIPIEKVKYYWKSDPKQFTWLYRLGCPPDEIDLKNICLKPKPVEPKILEQLNLI